MRSIRYAALAILMAVYGLVLAQERASKPATSADATTQDDASAAESEANPADAEDPAPDAVETAEATASPGNDAEAASASAPAATTRKPASATGSPQRFEPTEKVRPDFDVAFPVDI